jgi:anti-sigma B factor antagonist
MRIEKRTANGAAVLTIHGKLTAEQGAGKVFETVSQLVREDRKQILVNLSGVDYIDSVGIDSLLSSHTTVLSSGGQLKFCCLNERPRRLLEMTRLVTVFDTFQDEDQALDSFCLTPVASDPLAAAGRWQRQASDGNSSDDEWNVGPF